MVLACSAMHGYRRLGATFWSHRLQVHARAHDDQTVRHTRPRWQLMSTDTVLSLESIVRKTYTNTPNPLAQDSISLLPSDRLR